MAQYWIPAKNQSPQIAPSLVNYKRGVGTDTTAISTPPLPKGTSSKPPYPYPTDPEPGNPTVIPRDLLASFHFAFLIRHPKHSIPSYYRCCIPPLAERTGFHDFRPDEAGYLELRQLFDYLRKQGIVGPGMVGALDGADGVDGDKKTQVPITLVDADDLLDDPAGMIEAFCKGTGIKYEPEMLKWDTDEHQRYAQEVFAKWPGFHDDAINSTELKKREHVSGKGEWGHIFTELTDTTEEGTQDRRPALRRMDRKVRHRRRKGDSGHGRRKRRALRLSEAVRHQAEPAELMRLSALRKGSLGGGATLTSLESSMMRRDWKGTCGLAI